MPLCTAPVAQWQSTGLWFQVLWVRIPSGAPLHKIQPVEALISPIRSVESQYRIGTLLVLWRWIPVTERKKTLAGRIGGKQKRLRRSEGAPAVR